MSSANNPRLSRYRIGPSAPTVTAKGLISTILLVLGLLLTAPLVAAPTQIVWQTPTYSITVRRPYQDVIDDINYAIADRNFRITGRNTIGSGIQARGFKQFPAMEIVHFCSLDYAREVLELAPDLLALMPCRIAVQAVGRAVKITAVLLPENDKDRRVRKFARRLNGAIREIVHSATTAR